MLVGDLPFGSYEVSDEQAVATAQRFVKEAGCDAVKLERGGSSVQRAQAIVEAGIPVMGHVGLTPQTATALGGYRSQGRTAERALEVAEDALALQEAGCFSIVFEAIPSDLTAELMPRLEIPVIGIGAGPATDGQVLVFHDLLGIYDGHAARFVKRYGDVRKAMVDGVAAYAADVRERRYPEPEHGYTMAPDERERLRELLAQRVWAQHLWGRWRVAPAEPLRNPPGGPQMKLNRFLPSPAMVVACIALFVAMGGSAAALATGVIDGREVKNYSLTGKDVKKDGLGGVTSRRTAWAPCPRPPACSHSAVVGPLGQFVRGKDVTSVGRTGDGPLPWSFNSNIQGCVYVASLGDPSVARPARRARPSTSGVATNANTVQVRTVSSTGNAADRPFHLIVSC